MKKQEEKVLKLTTPKQKPSTLDQDIELMEFVIRNWNITRQSDRGSALRRILDYVAVKRAEEAAEHKVNTEKW